jgi:hypothetical protein
MLTLATPAVAASSFPSNGWTNPDAGAPYEDWNFGSCDGSYLPNRAHLGADSQGTGSPKIIRAMGSGTVVRTESGWPGGSLGIEHKAGDGSRFVAVYGHINIEVTSGNVAAGQRIGTLYDQGSNDHLHLGVRPLKSGESGSSVDLRGGSDCNNGSASLYGYVNPLPWLAAHEPTSSPPARPGDGGLVRTPNGKIYRIVGGAPLHISRCDYTNGCAGVVNVPDLDGYRSSPRDGALLRNVDDGGIYRFAGGGPLWISSCAYTPGCAGVIEVDGHPLAANDHMRATPADGTLVQNQADGGTYRFAGGAPLWISSCDYAPGCKNVTRVDGGTFSRNGAISGAKRMRADPADGTLVRNQADGGIYRFAGGAPLWISSCAYGGGCPSVVSVDAGTFSQNGAISGSKRMRSQPADRTLIRDYSDGRVFRFAGGAPLWISGCNYGGGCAGAVAIDKGTLSQDGAISGDKRMRAYPAAGTYLRVGDDGRFLRVAGGAPLEVSDCAALDGRCSPAVAIDGGTLRERALGRLRARPASDTALHGRPSDTYWTVTEDDLATASAGGVQVSDAALVGLRKAPTQAAPAPAPATATSPESTPAPPAPPTGGSPQQADTVDSPLPAKLEVERARVLRRDRMLDVLAPITGRASGGGCGVPRRGADGGVRGRDRLSEPTCAVQEGDLGLSGAFGYRHPHLEVRR